MTWQEALFERRRLGVRFDLDLLRSVDAELRRPFSDRPVVQVVGTNGKGSTCAMLAAGLRAAGKRVGLYTSPHLHRVGERVRIDGVAVEDSMIQRLADQVIAAEERAGHQCTFFELLTLVALLAFEEQGVEVGVLEAGLGGRLDATRLRASSLTLVSRIGLDHEEYLGHGLSSIAAEKAAVFHRDAPAFSVEQEPEVTRVLEETAREVGTSLRWVEPLATAPLAGEHQRQNAGLALAGLQHFSPDLDQGAFRSVSWPGRLETVEIGTASLVFDVAHNLDGIAAVVSHASQSPPDLVVFGCMADKPVDAMLEVLSWLACPVCLVPPPREGAMQPPESLRRGWHAYEGADDPEFTDLLWSSIRKGRRVLVCGSHFLVARLRASLTGMDAGRQDPVGLSDPLLRG